MALVVGERDIPGEDERAGKQEIWFASCFRKVYTQRFGLLVALRRSTRPEARGLQEKGKGRHRYPMSAFT